MLGKSARIKNVMNKNESKYFNTAVKMDKAFLRFLKRKILLISPLKKSVKKQG